LGNSSRDGATRRSIARPQAVGARRNVTCPWLRGTRPRHNRRHSPDFEQERTELTEESSPVLAPKALSHASLPRRRSGQESDSPVNASAESAPQFDRMVLNPKHTVRRNNAMATEQSGSESRFQRWRFVEVPWTLGRCPRFATANPSCGGLALNAAPLVAQHIRSAVAPRLHV